MFAKERQNKIYDMIKSNGSVTTSELVKIFNVSIETIRRDLLYMEKTEQLLRVHGGAVARGEMKPYLNLDQRNKEFGKQKRNLAIKAMEFISEGDIIGIDSGSTAIVFAEVLKDRFSNLTAVTHSLDVFNILSGHFPVILCGGHYLQEENAFYGPLTLQMLKSICMQKVFIFPSAVSFEHGICDYQKELFQIQKQLINSSENVFCLADSSKFEKRAFLKVGDMKTDYSYISDSGLPEKLIKLYRKNNIKIYMGEGKV